ncbi:MAG: ACT domain-containing protein [Marinobacter sp.]|uniref:ACT domain-containing protein n=1 Tax=Marinobacter sp. TaxID=50741 RepID=UPI00396F0184
MTPRADISMPSYTLNCRMAHEAAALERLCQVVRIRGFRIARMAVESAEEHLDIALTLEGTRPIAMLQSQLEKLHTVAEVALASGSVARSRSA